MQFISKLPKHVRLLISDANLARFWEFDCKVKFSIWGGMDEIFFVFFCEMVWKVARNVKNCLMIFFLSVEKPTLLSLPHLKRKFGYFHCTKHKINLTEYCHRRMQYRKIKKFSVRTKKIYTHYMRMIILINEDLWRCGYYPIFK